MADVERDPEDELCATCNYTWSSHTIVGSEASSCPFKPSGTWPDVVAPERENPVEYDEAELGTDV